MVFLTPTIDVSKVGKTLNVGNVNASIINIGKNGTTVNLNGIININGTVGSGSTNSGLSNAYFYNSSNASATFILTNDIIPNSTILYETTGFGYNTLMNLTTDSSENSAFGSNAGKNMYSGSQNAAFGNDSLFNISSGSYNTAMGSSAMNNVSNMFHNTGIGYFSLRNISGNYNTAIGSMTNMNNNGNYNIAIGYNSSTGTNSIGSTVIGSNSTTNNYSYSTALGYGVTNTSSNQIMLGQNTQTVRIPGTLSVNNLNIDISGNVSTNGDITGKSLTITSDYRLKENVSYLTDYDRFSLELLKPCTFNFKNNIDTKIGFIAHELQEIIPFAVKGKKDGDIQSVDYSAVISVCVLKIQSLMKEIKEIKDIIRIDKYEK